MSSLLLACDAPDAVGHACHDLDEGQNLTTTDAPALSIARVVGGKSKERS